MASESAGDREFVGDDAAPLVAVPDNMSTDECRSSALESVVSTTNACSQPVILGFDPGRQKCGLAVMGLDRVLFHRSVVVSEAVLNTIADLQQQFPISLIVMGDQTAAAEWKEKLTALQEPLRVVLIDERYSSLEARDRYWQLYPPKGWQKLLPQGMRQPSVPIDDIVAMLLIERYLNRLTEG